MALNGRLNGSLDLTSTTKTVTACPSIPQQKDSTSLVWGACLPLPQSFVVCL